MSGHFSMCLCICSAKMGKIRSFFYSFDQFQISACFALCFSSDVEFVRDDLTSVNDV